MISEDATIRCTIKEYRRRKGLSQDELALLIGVRRQAVYDMEAGRYLPNTAVALRLARVLGCTVEMLFIEESAPAVGDIHLLDPLSVSGGASATTRISLTQVRDRLVGVPLRNPFRLEAADGFLLPDKRIDCQLVENQLHKTVLVMGCDPALSVLSGLLSRTVPGMRAHVAFASSRQALLAVHAGNAHIAGIHYHGNGETSGNVAAVRALSPDMDSVLIGFSMQEEGLMVAGGNPLDIHSIEDMANGRVRFVNREEGAALRTLLDTQLSRLGIPTSAVNGYADAVCSHADGAMRVAAGMADAALGLRVVAEYYGLNFVPLAATRCDLVIPSDLREHPGVAVLLDVLQSAGIRKELGALPGYDASYTGKLVEVNINY